MSLLHFQNQIDVLTKKLDETEAMLKNMDDIERDILDIFGISDENKVKPYNIFENLNFII